jgi:hypothetical protein
MAADWAGMTTDTILGCLHVSNDKEAKQAVDFIRTFPVYEAQLMAYLLELPQRISATLPGADPYGPPKSFSDFKDRDEDTAAFYDALDANHQVRVLN